MKVRLWIVAGESREIAMITLVYELTNGHQWIGHTRRFNRGYSGMMHMQRLRKLLLRNHFDYFLEALSTTECRFHDVFSGKGLV